MRALELDSIRETKMVFVEFAPHLKDSGYNNEEVFAFAPFVSWRTALESLPVTLVKVHGIEVTAIDRFGSRIGFVKAKANVKWSNDGKSVPGITLLRGGSVAVLLLLKDLENEGGEPLVALTRQPRIPIGSIDFLELPAGMLDGFGSFAGVAATEVQEETGIVIKEDELIDMTELALGKGQDSVVYPSPGACDETMRLFLTVKRLPLSEIESLRSRLTGLRDEGERISLTLVPFSKLWNATRDMKALSALALYNGLANSGVLFPR